MNHYEILQIPNKKKFEPEYWTFKIRNKTTGKILWVLADESHEFSDEELNKIETRRQELEAQNDSLVQD